MLKGNSAGSVLLADILTVEGAGVASSIGKKSGDCFDSGLLKVIRSGNWPIKAAIVQGSFTV